GCAILTPGRPATGSRCRIWAARLAAPAPATGLVARGPRRSARPLRRGRPMHLAFVATLTLLFLRSLLTLWRGIAGNRAHLLLRHVHPHAALELARQFDGAVAHAHQPAYRQANRFEHTAHLAVASLRQRHA